MLRHTSYFDCEEEEDLFTVQTVQYYMLAAEQRKEVSVI